MTEPEAMDWIGALFQEKPGSLKRDTKRADVEAWDSLGVLLLMSALDNDFGITLSDEQLGKIDKVGDVIDVLRQRGVVVLERTS